MAGKGGKGGGNIQSALGGLFGGGSGGIMERLRGMQQGFQPPAPPQFAPVPPPMQTPGQQFAPFGGQQMPTDFGRQQPQFAPPGQPVPGQLPPGVTQLGPESIITEGPGFLPQPQPQFAPAGRPVPTLPTQPPPQGTPFGGVGGDIMRQPLQTFNPQQRNPIARPSPLGPLVSPRGNLRKGAF